MAFKGSLIRMIVSSCFILAITTVIHGRPGVTSLETVDEKPVASLTRTVGDGNVIDDNNTQQPASGFVVNPPAVVKMEEYDYSGIGVGNEVKSTEPGQEKISVSKDRYVMFNGQGTPEVVNANRDIMIKWDLAKKLFINDTKIAINDKWNKIIIEYQTNGGIKVNGRPIAGFDDIIFKSGTGKTILQLKEITYTTRGGGCLYECFGKFDKEHEQACDTGCCDPFCCCGSCNPS